MRSDLSQQSAAGPLPGADPSPTARGSGALPTAGRAAFLQAVEAARRGRYGEAETLVRRATSADPTLETEGLHLRAKINAQRGLYPEARECWREAAERDPDDCRFPAGLLALEDGSLRRRARRLFGIAARVGLVLAAVALVALVARHLTAEEVARARMATQIDALEAALEARQAELLRDLRAAESDRRRADERLAGRLDEIASSLRSELADRDQALATRLAALRTSGEATARHADDLSTTVAELRAELEALGESGGRRLDLQLRLLERLEALGASGVSEVDGDADEP